MKEVEPKKRALIPSNGNDIVMTPVDYAVRVIKHFNPQGSKLDPCRGDGAFYNNMTECDWCEIREGRDFYECDGHYDWIMTNPPWSIFRDFNKKAMEVADNVAFLSSINAYWMKARLRDMREHGFGIKEILIFEKHPPKPFPQTGLQLGVTHIQKGWEGDIKFSMLKEIK